MPMIIGSAGRLRVVRQSPEVDTKLDRSCRRGLDLGERQVDWGGWSVPEAEAEAGAFPGVLFIDKLNDDRLNERRQDESNLISTTICGNNVVKIDGDRESDVEKDKEEIERMERKTQHV